MVSVFHLRQNEWRIVKSLLSWEGSLQTKGWKSQEEIFRESNLGCHKNNLRFHYLNLLVKNGLLEERTYPFIPEKKRTKRQRAKKHPTHWRLSPTWRNFKLLKMTLSSVYGGAYFKSIPISLEEFEKSSYAKSDIFNRVSLEDELCNNGEIIEKLEEQRKSIEKQINERKIREKELGEEIHTGAMKEYTEIMKGTLPIQLSVKKIKTKEVNSKSGGDTSIRP